MPRLVGYLAAMLLFGGLTCLAGSCTGLLGLDGYSGAVRELCALLRDCYGSTYFPACEEWLGRTIEQADPSRRQAWLTAFGDSDCLRNCTRGRRCLDGPPVCGVPGAPCSQKEQCCGFTKGEGICGEPGDAAVGQCCLPGGLPCTVSSACCHGDCSPLTYTCGGQVCANEAEPCQYDTDCCSVNCGDRGVCLGECLALRETCGSPDECCSGKCDAGFCACRANGEPCTTSSECCSSYCDLAGQCAETTECANGGEACGELECCAGFDCGTALGAPVCCLPNGGTCSGGDECCSLGCQQSACCAADGVSCGGDSDCCFGGCVGYVCSCAAAEDPCVEQQDCCQGLACANDGTSVLCKTCAASSCHSVCDLGAPLSLSLAGCAEVIAAEPCIQAICQVDAWCCCVEWDDVCQQEVWDNALVPGMACWGLCA
jgi:hypothetical protein